MRFILIVLVMSMAIGCGPTGMEKKADVTSAPLVAHASSTQATNNQELTQTMIRQTLQQWVATELRKKTPFNKFLTEGCGEATFCEPISQATIESIGPVFSGPRQADTTFTLRVLGAQISRDRYTNYTGNYPFECKYDSKASFRQATDNSWYLTSIDMQGGNTLCGGPNLEPNLKVR